MREVRISFLLLLALSLAGILTATFLSHLHYTLSFGKSLAFQLCQKGCDTVNTSSYSEFYGIPIASYGALIYSEISIASLLGLLLAGTALSSYLFFLIFLMATASLAVSFLLAAISIFKLSSFCNLCGFTYLINFLLVLISGAALKKIPSLKAKTAGAAGDYSQKMVKTLVTATLLLNALSGFAIAFFHSDKYRVIDKEKTQKFFENYSALPRMSLQTSTAPTKGSQNPKLTIVVFSDFTCGFCRNGAAVLDRLLPEYRNDLRIVYKHEPHDKTCNPYQTFASPRKSCDFSIASLCAQKYGKFWEYHDLLFKDTGTQTIPDFISFARKTGIDEQSFRTCLADPTIQERLLKDIEEAHRLGVQSTPTFFLNGKMVQGLPPTPLLHQLIQREIQERSSR